MSRMSVPTAIQQMLSTHLSVNDDFVLMGETVGRSGGIAGSTQGLLNAYGSERVIDTPISDRATLGIAMGMAIAGKSVVVELSGSSRISACFEVIVHACAVARHGEFPIHLTIRIPCGAQAGNRLDRSASELLSTVSGLTVYCPWDGGQLHSALSHSIKHSGVSVVLESRALHQQFIEAPPTNATPTAPVQTVRSGEHITLVSWGTGVQTAMQAADQLQSENISTAVVALHQLHPIDADALGAQVRHTGRAICIEAPEGGLAANVLNASLSSAFLYLEAPLTATPASENEILRVAREAVFY